MEHITHNNKNYFSCKKAGFTIAELLISVSIIAIMAFAGIGYYRRALDKGKVSQAVSEAHDIRRALQAYHADLGFYPPDVCRGNDPGIIAPQTNCAACGGTCTPGWDATLLVAPPVGRWLGPYIDVWPDETPWGGEYDYNYWAATVNRGNVYGGPACIITNGGIYIGIEPTNAGQGRISRDAEEFLVDEGIDADGCVNGEAQILVDTSF